MDTQRICPSCQTPLRPDVPLGLCPACLVKAGLPTGTEAPGQSGFVPPTLAEMAGFFPQLEILEFIGKGGMGAVYKARQKQLDRIVALKVLPPGIGAEAGFAERFAREARAMARLNHPGIVTLFEFGQASGLYFFLMEFVDGVNLRQLLATRQVSPREALAIVPQICDALQYAHDQGIVHRDIKPENILMDRRGRAKLADFGLAKLMGADVETAPGAAPIGGASAISEAGKVMGTPNYMAPEQRDRPAEVDNRADIYALGVVFYQMLTGELPGRPIEPPSRKAKTDVRLDKVVLRALEDQPGQRYQQASELKTNVETIAQTPPAAPGQGGAGTSPIPPAGLPPGTPGGAAPLPFSSRPPAAARRDLVTAPAVGLIVGGALKLLYGLVGMATIALPASGLGMFDPISSILPSLHLTALAAASEFLTRFLPGVAIVYGGVQMLRLRSYAWANAAAILSVLSVLTCSVFGLGLGIWALNVLSRAEVRDAFYPNERRAQPAGGGSRGGSGWKALGIVLVVLLLVFGGFAVIAGVAVHNGYKALTNGLGAHFGPVFGQYTMNSTAHEESTMTLPIAADGRFSLDNVNGAITVTGGKESAAVLQVVKDGPSKAAIDAVKTEVQSDTNSLTIHTRHPDGVQNFNWFGWWGNNDAVTVRYTIELPAHATIEKIDDVNGNISISGICGDIAASTVNGDATVRDARGSLELETVNGHLTAHFRRLGEGQHAKFEVVNGSVDVALPTDGDATVSAETVNGKILTDFSAFKVEHQFPAGSELSGVVGNGKGTVHAETVNGAIHFERAALATVD